MQLWCARYLTQTHNLMRSIEIGAVAEQERAGKSTRVQGRVDGPMNLTIAVVTVNNIEREAAVDARVGSGAGGTTDCVFRLFDEKE